MTREEAINIMNVIVHMLEEKYDTDRVEEAVEMAIKALEQESCEGCDYKEWLKGEVEPKTGRWIKHENPNLGQCGLVSYECSSCGVWLGCQYFSRRSYCPNCGAKMESEDKE